MTSKAKSELERRVKTLEHSLAEVNGRLNDDERQVAELQSSKTKAEKDIEGLMTQLDEAEEKHRALEREKATLASQLQDAQVRYDLSRSEVLTHEFFSRCYAFLPLANQRLPSPLE